MRYLILIFPLFLTACGTQTEYVPLRVEIPNHLLLPTPISDRQPSTYRDLAILATEHLNSARQGNDDKAAIREILASDDED